MGYYRRHFWSKVDQTADSDGCWVWHGGYWQDGYGRYGKTSERAHRVAWELTNGPIPVGMVVCHRCDNRFCVNPSHLFLGTQADNIADKVKKGRQSKGPEHGRYKCCKLTPDDVRAIRKIWSEGGVTQRELAAAFGVDQARISEVVNRKTFKHIT